METKSSPIAPAVHTSLTMFKSKLTAVASLVAVAHKGITTKTTFSEPQYLTKVPPPSLKSTELHRNNIKNVALKMKQVAKKSTSQLFNFVSHCWQILWRSAVLSFTYLPTLIFLPLLMMQSDQPTNMWWQIMKYCISNGGPCSVKFAQWLATRPDLFPSYVCQQLQSLQSRTKAPSWSEIDAVLTKNYGSDYSTHLSIDMKNTAGGELVPKMAGSGCVAYVVHGKLLNYNRPNDDSDHTQTDNIASQQPVAIKITHENVAAIIRADIQLMRILAATLEYIVPDAKNMSLSESVNEFSALMLRQICMEEEARSLDRFRKNFHIDQPPNTQLSWFKRIASCLDQLSQIVANTNIHNVQREITFPEPIWELTNHDILVETFEDGILMHDLMRLTDVPTKKKIAQIGLDAIFKMIFIDNFIHADLHPGNIICLKQPKPTSRTWFDRVASWVQTTRDEIAKSVEAGIDRDGIVIATSSVVPVNNNAPNVEEEEDVSQYSILTGDRKLQLSFIDAGLTVSLRGSDRRNFVDLFKAVIQNDGRAAGRLMIERSQGQTKRVVNEEVFIEKMREIVDGVHQTQLSLGKVEMNSLLQKVLVLCYQHQVKLESRFVSVVVAIGVLEGMGRQLDPEVDILARVAPYALRATMFGIEGEQEDEE